jgi:hypothetical protein
MLSRDGVSGLVCLAVSAFLLVLTFRLPPAAIVSIGPAFYPGVVLSLTALLSAILIVMDVRAMRALRAAGTAPAAPSGPAPNYRLVLFTFIEFGLYIALLPELGFRIATFLFVLVLQITLEWPETWKRWLIALAIAVGTSAACHFVFEGYLSVLLPRGTWSGM